MYKFVEGDDICFITGIGGFVVDDCCTGVIVKRNIFSVVFSQYYLVVLGHED